MSKSTVPTRKGRTAYRSPRPSTAASLLSSAQSTVPAPKSDTVPASRKARSPCLSHMSKPTLQTSHTDRQSIKPSTAASPSPSVGDPKANTTRTKSIISGSPLPSVIEGGSSTKSSGSGSKATTSHACASLKAASPRLSHMSKSTVPTRNGRTACHSCKLSTPASLLSSAQSTVPSPKSDTLTASRKARSPCLSHMSKPTVPTSHTASQSIGPSTAASATSAVGDPKASTSCTSGRIVASTAVPTRAASKVSFGSSYPKSPERVTSLKAAPEITKSDSSLPTEPDGRQGDHEKERVYLLYDRYRSEPFCLKWRTFNLKEREATTLEISPSSDTQQSLEINANASAVALGSLIYILGGSCRSLGSCYEGIRAAHAHTNVYYFDTRRPNDGWNQAAPMNFARILPAVVAVDGKIFVIGGVFPSWSTTVPGAEVYDPKTNLWEPLPGSPYLKEPPRYNMRAAVQIIDPNDKNKRRILFQPDFNSLHSFNLSDNSWSVIDENFDYWDNAASVVDNILYFFSRKSKLLQGYDLINNTWLPVEFRELADLKIKTAAVHNVGNGKLCLLCHGYEPVRGLQIVCVTFKVKKEMYGDKPMQLTAIEVSRSSFDISSQFFRNLLVF